MYTKVIKIIAGRYDKVFTWDTKVKMMGKSHQDSAQILIGREFSGYFLNNVTSHLI